uniref:Uncharacterized protein n=1 Tax=Panagrolaimus superbus TaxID=310955 RepID=A0A914XXC3_9BILA
MGVGLGVAMMMQQAGALVGATPQVDIDRIEAEVRKAKAEGRTVTLINGCLYFDYQLVAQIPPHVDLSV